MSKLYLSLLLWLMVFPVVGQTANVCYGDRSLSDTRLAVYYDKDGTLYPDYTISCDLLVASGGSLKKFYRDNPDEFAKIAMLYQCEGRVFTDDNFTTLNTEILKRLRQKINSDSYSSSSVTFLIHGFRKPFTPTINSEFTSVEDYTTMKNSIADAQHRCIVEVYWDGLYGCCFSAKPWKNKPLFLLFEQAQSYNAIQVGKALNLLLNSQQAPRINIITHSLGAKVACYALFDIDGDTIATPTNTEVNVYMIAPAIGSATLTDNYFKRNSTVPYKTRDNYNLKIVYNEDDFVLLKRDPKISVFGPGPKDYGYTTLGCNYKHEAEKMKEFFKQYMPNSPLEIYNHSFEGTCHLVRCYFSGNDLKEIFSDLK
ncbi:alpha/beta hydrolase [Flavobacterium beibuense]|uniref:Alpha/beta hydrolase n=1 Tax=Flavobacterium beibuense TaxID=657326 RepID=A0A444WEX1_9FLAO|nr:alpha/beta hydrolase [Flavobacterium beibuense]RYJ44254.1 hypothetical protein NU09_0864 [Flavobacterium beibuense]